MPPEPSAVDLAIVRALRDNLERIQRNSDELQQAVNDVIAACSSSKPTNALPPMLRAQTSAASLEAPDDLLNPRDRKSTRRDTRRPRVEHITQAIGVGAPDAPAGAHYEESDYTNYNHDAEVDDHVYAAEGSEHAHGRTSSE